MSEATGEPTRRCDHIRCSTFANREEYCGVQLEDLRSDIYEVTTRFDRILAWEVGKPWRAPDKPHNLVSEAYFLIDEVRVPAFGVNHALKVEVFYEKNTRTKSRAYRITTRYEYLPMRGYSSMPSRLPEVSFPLNEYSIEYDGGLVYAVVSEPKFDEETVAELSQKESVLPMFDEGTMHTRPFTLYDTHLLGRLLDTMDEVSQGQG